MIGRSAMRPGTGAQSYPNKYMNLERPADRMDRPIANKGGTVFPLSLFFLVLILLALSITLPSDGDAGELDSQLGMRMVGYAAAALSVLWALGRRKLLFDRLIFAWALIPAFIMVSAVYALDPLFSVAAGLAHLILLFFAWRLVTRGAQVPIILAIVLNGLIIGALSLIAYYAFPEVGRAPVELYSSAVEGRMRGVTPQPNALGSVAALTILLVVMYFRLFTARQRILAAGALAVSTLCLFYSDSRTSFAALALCLFFWWLRRTNVALNLFTIVAAALAACLVIMFVPDVSALLTRGDAGPDDLSSLNGRSRIWDVAWESIYAHPVLGQGYSASRMILPIDDRLFGAAVNTHNLYIELLFSGGLALFAIFVIAVTGTMLRAVLKQRTEALILLLFFLVRGGAEAAPFAGLPLLQALIFYIAVSMCLARSLPGKEMAAHAIGRSAYRQTWNSSTGLTGTAQAVGRAHGVHRP